MGILSILSKGIQAMIEEVNTPASFKVGEAFEHYVREFIFIDRYYTLIEKTHDYHTNSYDYVESSLKPDFKFRDNWTGREFYVEAKFRTGLYKDKLVWCNQKQLDRYQYYHQQCPVFVIIGLGNDPQYPEALTLIPLAKAKYTGLHISVAEKFEIEPDKAITSKGLWPI